jgi:hypothetical protein
MHETGSVLIRLKAGELLKKFFIYMLLTVAGIAVGLSAALAAYYFSGGNIFENILGSRTKNVTASISTDATNAELTEYAFKILGYIKTGDYNALSQVVHPEYGVVFSPYATINLASNKCFTAAQVSGFSKDKNQYVWGKYDGKGDPIELTPAEYFKKFVFDKDYTQASEIGLNTIVKSGNSLENIKEVFPDARFVDFYIPGTDQDSGGLDWSSVRLCFEEYKGQLKLTVILHSEWTV